MDFWVLAISFVVLLPWVIFLLDRRRWWPGDWRLGEVPTEAGAATNVESAPSSRDTLVAIPARDEADVVDECLSSVLAQHADFARLVYVDDRSSDGTGRIAAGLVDALESSAQLEVVEGRPPPPGWTGKLSALNRALEVGLESSQGDSIRWILFTDADIRHPPGSIRALREIADRDGYDLVSVMVQLRATTFWERLLIPPFVYFFQVLYPFRRVSDPSSTLAAAAGGCVLISREVLERSGGLEGIRGAIIDDVSLARQVKAAGGKLWLGLCEEMRSVRKYDTLGEIVHMVARTAFTQLEYRYSVLAASVLAIALFLVSPPIVAGWGLATGVPVAALTAGLAWAIQAATLLPVVRWHGVRPIYALTLPFASALYAWMTLLSAWRHFRGRGPAWKGREVGLGKPPPTTIDSLPGSPRGDAGSRRKPR